MRSPAVPLSCPACGAALHAVPGQLRCPAGHAYDVARQGYVNLLAGTAPAPTGDTGEMVRARAEFLAAGHYRPLDEALAGLAERLAAPGDLVVDAGCGTGTQLAAVLDRLPGAVGLALDASKHAARRAARSHPRTTAAVWDTWRPWPLPDGVAGLLVDVLAPRNAAEFRRVLRPDGALLVVTPGPRHLASLVAALDLLGVDAAKDRRLEEQLGPHFEPIERTELALPLTLAHEDVRRLVRMGPSAWHVEEPVLVERLGDLPDPAATTAVFEVTVHRPRRHG